MEKEENARSIGSSVAWTLCALVFVGTGGIFLLMFLSGTGVVASGLPFLSLASAVVGGLVASRQPGNAVGWIFLASAILATLRILFEEYASYGIQTAPGTVPFAEVAATLSVAIRMPGPVLVFVLLPLFFPNGRPPSPRWNILVWVVIAMSPPIMVFDALAPGVAVYGTNIRNPIGQEFLAPYVETFGGALIFWFIGLIFAAAASVVVRFRAAEGTERQQIKWLALAAAVIPVWFSVNAPIDANFPLTFAVADSLIIAGIPVAAGVAILRYRLYDIDFIINKALVYTALTAMLVVVYLGLIAGMQRLAGEITGEKSQLAVVVSTLSIAALFSPFRRRIQSFIDRRFYRRRYDARATLDDFARRLRDDVELEHLTGDLASVVSKTFQPEHVSISLLAVEDPRPENRRNIREFPK